MSRPCPNGGHFVFHTSICTPNSAATASNLSPENLGIVQRRLFFLSSLASTKACTVLCTGCITTGCLKCHSDVRNRRPCEKHKSVCETTTAASDFGWTAPPPRRDCKEGVATSLEPVLLNAIPDEIKQGHPLWNAVSAVLEFAKHA